MSLRLVPVSFREARRFVGEQHRHNVAPNAWKFGVGVHDGEALRGVGIAGNPNSRMLDDGVTLELLRVCTDGAPNACSMIYGALCRAGKALGYERFITYTLASEPGSSLKAAGFVADKQVSGDRSWWRPSRPTATPDQNLFGEERRPMGDKIRWVKGEPGCLQHIDGSDHAFKPGTTVDNDPPSDLWCDVCGESRAKAHPELIDGQES